MKREYLIRAVNDGTGKKGMPYGRTDWSQEEAMRAAEYNSTRWGKFEVVTREVTEWEVLP